MVYTSLIVHEYKIKLGNRKVLVTDAVASVTNTQVAQKLYRASVNML